MKLQGGPESDHKASRRPKKDPRNFQEGQKRSSGFREAQKAPSKLKRNMFRNLEKAFRELIKNARLITTTLKIPPLH